MAIHGRGRHTRPDRNRNGWAGFSLSSNYRVPEAPNTASMELAASCIVAVLIWA